MNRKQQEAEMAEVSILIIIIITTGHHSKRVTTERRTGSDIPRTELMLFVSGFLAIWANLFFSYVNEDQG